MDQRSYASRSARAREIAHQSMEQALRRWTVSGLAREAGLTRQSVQSYFAGRRMPNMLSGMKLANALGVSYEEFVVFLVDRRRAPVRGRSAESVIRPQAPTSVTSVPPPQLPDGMTAVQLIRWVEELPADHPLRRQLGR